jgi:hypothetical protein
MTTTLKIEPTEYTRQDGLKVIKLSTSKWVVQRVYGPDWFYSDPQSKWLIDTTIVDLDDVGMPFERAMELLNTLPELT